MWRKKKDGRPGERRPREGKPWRIVRLWNALKEPRRLRALRWTCLVLLVAGAGIGTVLGMRALDRRVQALPAQAEPMSYRLRLADRAAWMPTSLVRQIARSIVPEGVGFNDPALTQKIHAAAVASPWVSRPDQVRVVKQRTDDPQMGLVEVYAEYRRPFALAGKEGNYCFIDAEAVRLPDDQAPRWQALVMGEGETQARQVQYVTQQEIPRGAQSWPIQYVIIDGVAAPPPPPGSQWKAEDLYEGIHLVNTIAGRRWANQITVIDVRNHNGRAARGRSQLTMCAQIGGGERTQIFFGRFALPGDYEIPTDVKLANLDNYAAEHNGRLAGYNTYIDVRHEQWLASSN